MSAINPVIQTPPRLNPEQFNADTSQTTAPAAQQGFSDTLHSVAARPVRKSASNKGQNSGGSGGDLPANGNSSPPPVTQAAPNPAAASAGANAGPIAPAIALPSSAVISSAAAPASGSNAAAPADSAAAAAGAAPPSSDTSTLVPTAGAAPTMAAAQSSHDGASAEMPAPSEAPALKVAAKSAFSSASSWVAGRNAGAMRAINPTGDNAAVAAGKSAQGGQDPGGVPTPDTSAATAVSAAPVDTAALLGAMQASSTASSATASEAAPAPAGSPGDLTSAPIGLTAANGELTAALPAMAAAAASTAQVVSTIAANVAADKKSRADTTESPSASSAASSADAAGAAQLLNTQGANHTEANAPPNLRVDVPVDSPEFGQNVANHVATMFDSNVNSAKLQVNPPALGPIEVRIAIQGDHAQVWMASHSAMTRDALQEAAPKLREMLNSQGFAQVSVDISQRSFQERTPMAHAYEWNREPDGASSAAASSAVSVTSRASSGTLDAYA